MVLSKFVIGILYGIIGQVLSFVQLQGGIRWGWNDKWSAYLILLGLPISWAFIKSVENFILAFNGEGWPARLIGFGIGVIVFSIMSYVFFKESMTPKTLVSIVLSIAIIAVQIFWKN